MPASAIALVSLSLLFAARPATRDTWAERDKAAKKACAAGHYEEGVEILAGLYVDTDDPTYVYNQGRCYEQNHQWTSAIDRFREYLRKRPKAKPAEKADVENHIAECESLRQKDVVSPVPTSLVSAAEPPQPLPPPAAPPVASPPPTVASATPVAAGSSSNLRVVALIVGSVGVATAAAGLALNLKANSLADDFNRTEDPRTKDSQSSYKTASMVCYAAGAGAVTTAVLLYVFGRPTGGGASVAVLPVSAGRGVSLGVRGSF